MPNASRKRLLQSFLELARVPSPSRREAAVAAVVRRRLAALGVDVQEDGAAGAVDGDCGNLIARLPATGPGLPALVLAAHLDTVEPAGRPPLRPELLRAADAADGAAGGEDAVWIGAPGTMCAADDKTGVAVLLELVHRLRAEKIPHGELTLLFTVCEEIELLGASEIDPAVYAGAEAGIVLDHSSPTEIVIGAPTKLALRIEVEGVGGHAACPEGLVSAAAALARVAARLPQGRLDADTTANLGILRAGTAINVVPDRAYAEYEMRSHRKDLLDFHLKYVLGVIEGAIRECRVARLPAPGGGIPLGAAAIVGGGDDASRLAVNAAAVEVEVEVSYERYHLEPDAAPVVLLSEAVRRATGEEARRVLSQGGSDANVFNARGLPTALLGCGMRAVHGVDERANLAEMETCADVLTKAVGMAGLPS